MKQKPELIAMLTHKDVTIADGYDVFNMCKDLPVQDWGFKNVGPEEDELKRIAKSMKQAGKTVYFEVISYNEEAYVKAAKLAAECEVDFVTGTKYSPVLHDLLKKANVGYSPFVGKVGCFYNGRSGMLMGEYADILAEAKDLIEVKGTTGIDVSAYRHIESPERVIDTLTAALPSANICIAGSVDTYEKIDKLFDAGVTKFTMGSALFDSLFVEGGFYPNLVKVLEYLKTK